MAPRHLRLRPVLVLVFLILGSSQTLHATPGDQGVSEEQGSDEREEQERHEACMDVGIETPDVVSPPAAPFHEPFRPLLDVRNLGPEAYPSATLPAPYLLLERGAEALERASALQTSGQDALAEAYLDLARADLEELINTWEWWSGRPEAFELLAELELQTMEPSREGVRQTYDQLRQIHERQLREHPYGPHVLNTRLTLASLHLDSAELSAAAASEHRAAAQSSPAEALRHLEAAVAAETEAAAQRVAALPHYTTAWHLAGHQPDATAEARAHIAEAVVYLLMRQGRVERSWSFLLQHLELNGDDAESFTPQLRSYLTTTALELGYVELAWDEHRELAAHFGEPGLAHELAAALAMAYHQRVGSDTDRLPSDARVVLLAERILTEAPLHPQVPAMHTLLVEQELRGGRQALVARLGSFHDAVAMGSGWWEAASESQRSQAQARLEDLTSRGVEDLLLELDKGAAEELERGLEMEGAGWRIELLIALAGLHESLPDRERNGARMAYARARALAWKGAHREALAWHLLAVERYDALELRLDGGPASGARGAYCRRTTRDRTRRKLAFHNAVDQAERHYGWEVIIEPPKAGEPLGPAAVALVDTLDGYRARWPEGPEGAQAAWMAALVNYNHGQWDPSTERLLGLVDLEIELPSDQATVAVEALISGLENQGSWARLQALPLSVDAWAEAMGVDEFQRTRLPAARLWAVTETGRLDERIAARRSLVAEYQQHCVDLTAQRVTLAEELLFALDFEGSVASYRAALEEVSPESDVERSEISLRAGELLSALGQPGDAIAALSIPLPPGDDPETRAEVQLLRIELALEDGDLAGAERWARKMAGDASISGEARLLAAWRAVEARARVGRLGADVEAQALQGRHERRLVKASDSDGPALVRARARALLAAAEDQSKRAASLRLTGDTDRELLRATRRQLAAIKKARELADACIRDSEQAPDLQTRAAVVKIDLYEGFRQKILAAPMPSHLTADQAKLYLVRRSDLAMEAEIRRQDVELELLGMATEYELYLPEVWPIAEREWRRDLADRLGQKADEGRPSLHPTVTLIAADIPTGTRAANSEDEVAARAITFASSPAGRARPELSLLLLRVAGADLQGAPEPRSLLALLQWEAGDPLSALQTWHELVATPAVRCNLGQLAVAAGDVQDGLEHLEGCVSASLPPGHQDLVLAHALTVAGVYDRAEALYAGLANGGPTKRTANARLGLDRVRALQAALARQTAPKGEPEPGCLDRLLPKARAFLEQNPTAEESLGPIMSLAEQARESGSVGEQALACEQLEESLANTMEIACSHP